MKEKIVVVGGYGHVGSGICARLGERYPGNVYAAGRSLEKSEAFSRSQRGKVLPMQLDSGKIPDHAWFTDIRLIIMCLDQTDPAFVQACLENGVHYIDVSASGDWFRKVERLEKMAEQNGASAVLSVGLAPGLTNLLARETAAGIDGGDLSIEIGIMLGLGDSHGQAAIEWTVQSMTDIFEVAEKGHKTLKQSFSEGRRADYGPELGIRTGYRFPFSDQTTLPRSLGAAAASTRLCFDSRLATRAVAALMPLGLRWLLGKAGFRKFFAASMTRFRLGSDAYAIVVESFAGKEDRPRKKAVLAGRNESDITAAAAAATAILVYEGGAPAGVHHSEEIFALSAREEALWLESRSKEEAEAADTRRYQARIEAKGLNFRLD